MDAFSEPIKTACKEKGIEYKGCFDCKGALPNLCTQQYRKSFCHPNQEGMKKAKAFAKKILTD